MQTPEQRARNASASWIEVDDPGVKLRIQFNFVQINDAILGGITGSGKYAQVLPGVDLYTGFAVAVKVVPQRQGDWLRREVQVLAKLQQLPSSSVARICEFRDHWTKNNCLCVAFERYGQNLTTALQTPRLSAFPMFQTKEITRQIIQAVGYLHDHGIIHTNLNPNNIVFVSNDTTTHQFYGMDNAFHERIILKSSEIRLVDFGGAREKASHCTGTVGTAGFRAPEIIAGWNWTETIDHFAIGCIVAQILTSSPLLQHSTDSKGEDFVVMDKILGPFPEDLAARIQWDFPAAVPSHGPQESLAQYPHPTTPKTLAERIEDRDALKLVRALTNLDHTRRGDLKHHEKCKFLVTYEM